MMSFLEMSIMGGIMALVITVLRAVLLNKLPKRTFVFLWEAAMLRLILPLSIPAITSVYTLFAKPQTAPLSVPQITVINVPAVTNVVPAGAFQVAAEPLKENVSSAIPVWTIVWSVGVVIMFSVFVLGYILVYRKYRYAEIVKDGYPLEWLAEQKLIRRVKLYRSDQTLSPLTYGIFRPVILLPKNTDTESSEQLNFILTHELTHIKRFDMLRKIIAAAVLCLHWFNPAVWVLFLLYNRDIELACDEAVVRKMNGARASGGDCRSAYAMALIGMEERQRGFSSLFNHFSKNAIEERIVAIMKTKKIGVLTGIAACMLAVGVTCSFATSAAANGETLNSSVNDTDLITIPSIEENEAVNEREINKKENEELEQLANELDGKAIIIRDEGGAVVEVITDENSISVDTENDNTVIEESKPLEDSALEVLKMCLGDNLSLPLDEKNIKDIVYKGYIAAYQGIGEGEGFDIYAVSDSEIFSATSGTVLSAKFVSGWGNSIIVKSDNGTEILYAHCNEINVQEGDIVSVGTFIGTVGTSGFATEPTLSISINK